MSIPEEYTRRIIGCAIEVHRILGPGLLEEIYERALEEELKAHGFSVCHQLEIPIIYKGKVLGHGLRLDLLVDNLVIIELKSVCEVLPVHYKQLLTYLRLTKIKLGFIINFNEEWLKDGIHRVINERD